MSTLATRQPRGVPVGGQFASIHRSETDLELCPATGLTAGRPLAVRLGLGENDEYNDLVDGQVIESLDIRRSEDDGTYWVSPAKVINFRDLIPAADLGVTDTERDQWLDLNEPVIEDFIGERYGAELGDGSLDEDWSNISAEFTAAHPGQELGSDQALNLAWNNTKIVQLHSEMDPGTQGAEHLGRLLREKVDACKVVPLDLTVREETLRLRKDPTSLDSIVSGRLGERELPDPVALAIAHDLGSTGTRPALAKLARVGYTDLEAATNELRDAYDAAPNPLQKRRIDMMWTWLHHGGDNA
ncbi:hypothetical protein [Arthrobacter sp. HLT1-21]